MKGRDYPEGDVRRRDLELTGGVMGSTSPETWLTPCTRQSITPYRRWKGG